MSASGLNRCVNKLDVPDWRLTPELLGLMSATKSFSGSGSKLSYQFTHLTVQEFLAAWFASTKLSAEEQRRLFQEKLEDDRFKMMFLFRNDFEHADHDSCTIFPLVRWYTPTSSQLTVVIQ